VDVSGKLKRTVIMNRERLSKSDFKKLMSQKDKKNTNLNHIILWFLNFDQSPEEITKQLVLTPTKTAVKGQEYLSGPNQTVKKIHKFSFWEYEWKIESNQFVGELVDKFIAEIIKPRFGEIKMLAKRIDAELKIVQYYYDGYNPGYHFSVDIMKILTEANLEIDIDTYCLTEE